MLVFIICIFILVVWIYYFLPWLYGKNKKKILKCLSKKNNSIVFTFDDGPSSVTLEILSLLDQYNSKATFFISGRNISGREHIVRKIANDGHEIGLHGHDHLNYWRVSPSKAIADIKLCTNLVNSALGVEYGNYPFRPPYGKLNAIYLLYLLIRRMPVVYWTIASNDVISFEQFDDKRVSSLIEKKGGAVILAHDHDPRIKDRELSSLKSCLEIAKQKNMKILTVSQLLSTNK